MKKQRVSKAEMARRLEVSRSQIDHLLDPEYGAITIGALTRAARAVGRGLQIDLR